MKRKEPLITDNIYHILNKSISKYVIFNSEKDYLRMIQMLRFYSFGNNLVKFSKFIDQAINQKKNIYDLINEKLDKNNKLVQIVSYCIMPTHFHLIIKQLKEDGILIFMRNILNSYARYFNIKYNRRGHLWENRFKNVYVTSDDQLLHLSRYIHLNPVTAGLVEKPDQWKYSSYLEYINFKKASHPLCEFNGLINMSPLDYQEFVEDQIDYQKELAKIKKITIE